MDAFTSNVFGIFISLATFDILENLPEWLWFFDILTFYDEYFEMPEGDPKSAQFEAVGLDSPFFIYNMGTVMLYIAYVTAFVAVTYTFNTLMYKHKCCKKSYRTTESTAFWNLPILIIQENYGVMMLAGLLTLEDVSLFLLLKILLYSLSSRIDGQLLVKLSKQALVLFSVSLSLYTQF